jgi:hypothetical protein
MDAQSTQQVRRRAPSPCHIDIDLHLMPFSSDVTPLLPSLFALLEAASPTFEPAVSGVLAVLSSPAFADGTGSATLTLPLLQWCAQAGPPIINTTLRDGPEPTTSALCRLLAGLGDHSTTYLAENLNTPLVQAFLHLMLSFTALPGSYGVDEEESERMLGFWYLLQEALWAVEFPPEAEVAREKEMWALAKAVYAELVAALRTKVRWPSPPTGWAKGARIPPASGVRGEETVGVCRSGRKIPGVCSSLVGLYGG